MKKYIWCRKKEEFHPLVACEKHATDMDSIFEECVGCTLWIEYLENGEFVEKKRPKLTI